MTSPLGERLPRLAFLAEGDAERVMWNLLLMENTLVCFQHTRMALQSGRLSKSGYNANSGLGGRDVVRGLMMIITFTSWAFTRRHFIVRRHELPFGVTRQLRALVCTSRASLGSWVCQSVLLTPAEFRKCVMWNDLRLIRFKRDGVSWRSAGDFCVSRYVGMEGNVKKKKKTLQLQAYNKTLFFMLGRQNWNYQED